MKYKLFIFIIFSLSLLFFLEGRPIDPPIWSSTTGGAVVVPVEAVEPSAPTEMWKFDEGSGTTVNDTKGTNDGTLNNIEAGDWSTDVKFTYNTNRSINFDNENPAEHMSLSIDNAIAQNKGAISFSLWTKSDSIAASAILIGFSKNGGGSSGRFEVSTGGSDIGVSGFAPDSDTSQLVQTASDLLSTNVWEHIAGSIDYANDSIKIYHNGVLRSTIGTVAFVNATTDNTTSDLALFGTDETLALANYDGLLDEIAIFDFVLTAGNAKWLFENSINDIGKPADPVAAWNFDEGSGTILNDIIGSDDGTVTNMVAGNWLPGGAFTHVGNSNLDFNVATPAEYVDLGDSPTVQNKSNVTFSIWMNTDADPTFAALIDFQKNGSAGSRITVEQRTSLEIRGGGRAPDSQTFQEMTTTNSPVAIGSWQHIFVEFDIPNDAVAIYVNNVLEDDDGTSTFTNNSTDDTTSDIGVIGVNDTPTSGKYNGQLDEIAVFDFMLTANEREWLFENTINKLLP